MFLTFEREKLIHAIIYFAQKTKHCHTLKLFKLLNFLDFEHFRQTGFSVTGLAYNALPNGPAPFELGRELDSPKNDMKTAIAVLPIKDAYTGKVSRRDIKPLRSFDASYFSPREFDILRTLAEIFRDAVAGDMSEVSHAHDLPWGKVYRNGEGENSPIPYDLALARV